MKGIRMLLLFAVALIVSCKATEYTENTNSNEALSRPYVVMVSIDGFRYDYAEKFGARNILSMKKSGASGDLIPSFPSKTFPNHYTLVTGMYPGSHGLTGNSFYSREKAEVYQIRDREKVEDGSWYRGTPLWVLAEKSGMLAASYFWVGSEADVRGIRPSYWYRYDSEVSNSARVDQVIDWLSYPTGKRPHMINLYFSVVDNQGHRYGPDNEETKKAVLEIDEQIGRLREGIKRSGLPVTLIVTADHGMVNISKAVVIDKLDFKNAIVLTSGSQMQVYHEDQDFVKVLANELKNYPVQVYLQSEIPDAYRLKDPDRAPDILVTVDPPNIVMLQQPNRAITGGTHGFDPYRIKEMHAVFCIEGPDIKQDLQLKPFENIHVYPLVAEILGLQVPEDIDGSLEVLKVVLNDN